MKALASFILLSIFLMIGCEDGNSILEPNNDFEQSMNKGRVIYTSSDDRLLKSVDSDVKTKYSKTLTVNGNKGGRISISHSWMNEINQRVNLKATLVIPKGAYKDDLTFDMIFDLENYALELYPSPFTFDIPVILDLKFTHVNLSGFDLDSFDFTYLDGKEELKYKRVKINENKGTIAVYGAVLHHFSRYGWTRTSKSKYSMGNHLLTTN